METLADCMNSILAQDRPGFELIVINDHSTDGSDSFLESIPDPRIRLLDNPGHGLVDALNHGIRQASTAWIARMDADDIMLTSRLGRQLDFLHAHPEIDCLGCCVALFPDHAVAEGMRRYIQWQNRCCSHCEIQNALYIESPFTHPGMVIRKSRLETVGGYRDGDFPEDYELWLRLNAGGARFGKVPEVLLKWRQGDTTLTRTHPRYREAAFNRVRYDYLLRDRRLLNARRILIWGAGAKTRRRVRPLLHSDLNIAGWIDIDYKKIGKRYSDLPVHSPHQGLQTDPDLVLACVNSRGARELIGQHLKHHGLELGRDYLFVG